MPIVPRAKSRMREHPHSHEDSDEKSSTVTEQPIAECAARDAPSERKQGVRVAAKSAPRSVGGLATARTVNSAATAHLFGDNMRR